MDFRKNFSLSFKLQEVLPHHTVFILLQDAPRGSFCRYATGETKQILFTALFEPAKMTENNVIKEYDLVFSSMEWYNNETESLTACIITQQDTGTHICTCKHANCCVPNMTPART